MQKSLSNARARQQLLDRLQRLAPDAIPLWGRMTAPQMLAHLADWMLMAKGELNTWTTISGNSGFDSERVATPISPQRVICLPSRD